jgi:2-dehydro-3-deoxyphosphogluconate aldolase/(4S)-4-hydroxy-2-oxoglutarate aldolase
MGSKLISKEILAKKDYEGLQKKMGETLELIKRIRA